VDLALIHNQHNPEIKADKGSVVKQLFEFTDQPAATLEKTVKTSGKIIRDLNIDELHVDSETKKASILENCSIRKLIFETAASIKGKLIFKNCFIESVYNEPYCFEQDLVFLGCTFKDEFLLKRLSFKKSLVFEMCTFEKNVTYNEIKIEEDLCLNYSVFKKKLFVSGNKCAGYIKCQINTIEDEISFEDNQVSKDINLGFIHAGNKITLFHNEIKGYLFLRQLNAKGKLDINMLNVEALTINDITIEGSVEINDLVLINSLRIKNMEVEGDVIFNTCKIGDMFRLSRSSFKSTFILGFLISDTNLLTNNKFEGDCNFNSCTFHQQTWITRNLYRKSFDWGTMHVHNVSFNNNYMLEGFNLNKTEVRDLIIDGNFFDKDIEINSFRANDIFINKNSTKQDFKIYYTKASDLAINKNNANQSFEIYDIKANNLKFNDNTIEKSFSLDKSELNEVSFQDNLIKYKFKIYDSTTRDIYLVRNEVKNDLDITFTNSCDLIFTENNVPTVTLSKSSFSEIAISTCKKIEDVYILNITSSNGIKINENVLSGNLSIDSCNVQKNIECKKNEVQYLELINTAINDILLEENDIKNKLEINDTKADDINLQGNKVAIDLENTMPGEKEIKGNESSENDTRGIMINRCNIHGELNVMVNDAPGSIQIIDILADKLTFIKNKTKSFEIGNSRFRLVNVFDCMEIWNFNCNNVTVSKDTFFSNNIFLNNFIMLYCKIENDLEFTNNQFNGFHKLSKNTVFGSLIYKTTNLNRAGNINTSFRLAVINYNNFNFVSIENTRHYYTFYFDNNTVQGNLRIGIHDLSVTDKTIKFPKAVSITGNKIENAQFSNLHFESSLCLQHNNFDGDLSFRNTAHSKTMDFTGCYVGGSFVFYDTSSEVKNGNLILDDVFIDKRISFTNYSPANFSFINGTFNGFEIPGNWKIKNKTLVNKNIYNRKEDEAGSPPGNKTLKKKLYNFFVKNKDVFVIKETALRKEKYENADLPYNLIKSHYESDRYLKDIPLMWKRLQSIILFNEEKKEILLSIERSNEILDNEFYISEFVSKAFIPVYYSFFEKEKIEDLANLSDYFAKIEHTSNDKEVIELVDMFKAFFQRFFYALKFFEKHIVYWGTGNNKKDQRIYKKKITTSLEEQYHVLRHIYGSNGELKEEDSAYYMWMHYKNKGEMHSAPLKLKPKYWIKYILYERVFGWGVDLIRILKSTGWLVILFAAIYKVMFWINPGLRISWDNNDLYGPEIGPFKSIVLALQTTFSAVLGDWAPIGAGAIKIPMTINAVLGILFVTFLIGAYGRKMLR
jgi:hypothetical protein